MKRILVFAAYFYPHVGGYEKVVYELSRRLVQKGYEVDIVTCNTERTLAYEELDGVHLYRLPCWNALNSLYPIPKPCPTSFRIWRGLLPKNYDAINTHTRFFLTSFLGFLFAKFKRIPLVHTEHGARHSIVTNRAIDLISRAYDHTLGALVVKSARRNIGVSQAACEFLKHLGAAHAQVIYDGIDTSIFKREKTNYRQKLGISNDTIVITFVGRLIYAKGVQDLISAFSKIKDTAPELKLLIVGDGPYRADLENLAQQTGCASNILFLGQKSQDEVIDVLSATDIFVNPSYSEGLGISVTEAASIGLPIIATDVGGTREIIATNETGILVKARDVGQLAEELRRLGANIELRKRLGENARRLAEQKFNWDKIVREYIELYAGLAEK
ncbi:MAG: glycosyltransferase family 4 protein [Chloroflexi bacterium]|nr:glycosyltransferase family 4 protein [Chloroflexota bacterium]